MGTVKHKDLTGASLHEPKAHAASHIATGSDPVNIGTFAGPDCGSLIPTSNNAFDLGSTARKFKDGYLAGTASLQDVAIAGIVQGTAQIEGINLRGALADGTYQHSVNALYNRQLFEYAFVLNGGGAAIPTGPAGDLSCEVAGTILQWTLIGGIEGNAAGTGSLTIDIWKDTYANYPPTSADTICGTHPAITDSNKNQDAGLVNWSTSQIAASDILRFNVDSVTALTFATLILKMRRA